MSRSPPRRPRTPSDPIRPWPLAYPGHHVLGEHPEDGLTLLEAFARHLRKNGDPVDALHARHPLHLRSHFLGCPRESHEVHEAIGHERPVARVRGGMLESII